MEDILRFMNEALTEAKKALLAEEIPVGCVIVDKNGEIIGRGHNLTNSTRNGTKHAEIVAIDEILKVHHRIDLIDCDLYVTCEPCILCASAIGRMNIHRVYFGCRNERFGGNGSILCVHNSGLFSDIHSYEVYPQILENEAIELFQTFYTTENRRAPENKRKRKFPHRSKELPTNDSAHLIKDVDVRERPTSENNSD